MVDHVFSLQYTLGTVTEIIYEPPFMMEFITYREPFAEKSFVAPYQLEKLSVTEKSFRHYYELGLGKDELSFELRYRSNIIPLVKKLFFYMFL